MTSAIAAYGTRLEIGDGGTPETFTQIAEVLDISGPEFSADTEDVTSHSSTGGWEEHIPTILRSGEISFEVNLVPSDTSHAALRTAFTNRTRRNWKLVFPDSSSTTWSFAAYVTGFSVSAPVAGKLGAEITLKLTGQPTLS
jgi:predicted secreted protein